DVDHFKELNDEHGHLFGDLALAEIARCMQKGLRDSDILGRYGGDEFFAILPETDMPAAYQVAERLRKNVEQLKIESRLGKVHVTVSIGVYSSGRPPSQMQEVLDAADEGLHQAKRTGRNRSVPAERQRDDKIADQSPAPDKEAGDKFVFI